MLHSCSVDQSCISLLINLVPSRAGLQLVHEQETDEMVPHPVEWHLERAILRAGLMRKENFGALRKVKWSRSSRTDKGVHALAAVIALKVHSASDHWQRDPEGLEHAELVNRYGTITTRSPRPIGCILSAYSLDYFTGSICDNCAYKNGQLCKTRPSQSCDTPCTRAQAPARRHSRLCGAAHGCAL